MAKKKARRKTKKKMSASRLAQLRKNLKKARAARKRHSFIGPVRKRGRKTRATSHDDVAHHMMASMKRGRKTRATSHDDVAHHMMASMKRGVHKIESVADHMMKSMKRGLRG